MTPSGIPDAAADAHGLMSAAHFAKLEALVGSNTGDVSIGTANGLSLAGQVLSLAAADGSNSGALTAGAQSIGGVKTYASQPLFSAGVRTASGTGGVLGLGLSEVYGADIDGSWNFRYASGAVTSQIITATGVFRTAAGSSANVGLGPFGDNNTGLQFPAADTINAYVGGALGWQVSATRTMFIGDNASITNAGTVTGVELTASSATNGFILGATRVLLNDSVNTYHLATSSHAAALASPNGTGSTDIATKAGTTSSDAATHASAKLFSVRTGIGTGSEVEKFWVSKAGTLFVGGNANTFWADGGNTLSAGSTVSTTQYFVSTNSGSTAFYAAANGAFSAPGTARMWSEGQGGSSGQTSIRMGYFAGVAHAAARLVVYADNMGGTPNDRSAIMGNGDFEHFAVSGGVVLRSPDGTRWRLTVSNAGASVWTLA